MRRIAVFLVIIGAAMAGFLKIPMLSDENDNAHTSSVVAADVREAETSGENDYAEYVDSDSVGVAMVPDCGSDQYCRQPVNYPARRMAALVARNADMVAKFIPAVPLALRYT